MTIAAANPVPSPARPLSLEELRQRGLEAVGSGLYEEALLIYEHALEIAREGTDPDAVDLMLCNRAAVRLELEATDEAALEDDLATLRGVLGRTTSAENGWLASYQLARLHELQHNFKKALFYARLARDRSAWTSSDRWRSSSLNILGNVMLADSKVTEAMEAYEEALESLAAPETARRARIQGNLGYCTLLVGQQRPGMRLLYGSLRTLRGLQLHRFCVSPHLDLAYGNLLADHCGRALAHAERALRLATAYGERTARKNALFLQGEALLRLDRSDDAMLVFEGLQREFFPDDPAIVYRLMAVDVLPLMNLRA